MVRDHVVSFDGKKLSELRFTIEKKAQLAIRKMRVVFRQLYLLTVSHLF